VYKISRPLGQFKESCGNCNFWNPTPPSDPIFTLRECYKYYEGDALLDNAKAFDPIPQSDVLIPVAHTPAHFKCAKYKQAQENQNGTYESEYKIPESNIRFQEKQNKIHEERYSPKAGTARASSRGNQEDFNERKAEIFQENVLPEERHSREDRF